MTMISGGQAVVEGLKREGVGVVFGIAGVHNLAIYDALYDTPQIHAITVRHEQTAAYMADGYARVSGQPGVCLTTTGPGAFNTLAAMHTALADCSPVLEIMSQVDSRVLGQQQGSLHEAKDQAGMFARVTNWNATVGQVGEIIPAIEMAMRVMRMHRPGPTAIEIPTDVLGQSELVEIPQRVAEILPQGQPEAIDRAVELLLAADRPVIWAGGGVALAGASKELQELAEILQAPVLTSGAGKGVLPEDHPLSLGVSSTSRESRTLVARADAALVVGIRLNARVIGTGFTPPPSLVQIDIDSGEIGRHHPVQVGVVGDAKGVLSQMLAQIKARGVPARESREAEIAGIRERMMARPWENGPVEMQLLADLRRALARSAVVVADMTVIGYWARSFFTALAPRTFLHPNGFGTLGFGFPVALGAKVAAPDRQVVALVGDGGFLFAATELATAVQNDLNVVTVVFNDNAFGMLKISQQRQYAGREIGVDLVNPDFVKFAESFGAVGMRVDAPSELEPALHDALAKNRPVVLEVPFVARAPRW